MLLDGLISSAAPRHISGATNIEVNEIAYDSRLVKPGTLFVAVPKVGSDAKSGGYQFVSQAIERGAVAVVTAVDEEFESVTTVQVDSARRALADISAEFFGHPSHNLHLFAVTGTDGKTTTCYLLEHILASSGKQTGLLGTVEIKIGQLRERNDDRMTTPESLDVQRLLRRMVDAGVTHAVLEASSHSLVLDRLRGCRLTACALTNITGDHLEFHGGWEAYLDAKASLFTDLAPGRTAVLNRDDPHFEVIAGRVTGDILSYGLHPDSEIRASHVNLDEGRTRFQIEFRGETVRTQIPLPGDFNMSNALAATGLAVVAGVPLKTIASQLPAAKAPEGRFQVVHEGQPFEVMIDYAHTINAFSSVLRHLRELKGGRLIAVFGAAGNRDRAKRPQLARIAEKYADFFVITNEDPYEEDPQTIIDEIASGVSKKEHEGRFICEPDRTCAIDVALRQARAGDTVVILGKGHEKSIVRNGSKEPWSDFDTVRRSLQRLG